MSVISGLAGSQATKSAAKTQAASTKEASGVQLEMYEKSRQDQMPWLMAGKESLADLQDMVSEGPGKFEDSEYYQEGLGESEKAINRYLASRGQYASGKAGKALSENAVTNMKKNRGNWLNEWMQTKLAPIQSMAGVGVTTAGNLGAEGMQTGYGVGQNIMSGANAIAQGKINSANVMSGASQNTANAIATYYGNKKGQEVATKKATEYLMA